MSSELAPPVVLVAPEASTPTPELRTPPFRMWVWRPLVFLWKYALGALFLQTFLGGILVVGWTYRFMQRSVHKHWWKQSSSSRKGQKFPGVMGDEFHSDRHWPNWILQQCFAQALRRPAGMTWFRYLGRLIRGVVHSLALNLKIGLQGIFNTWVLTMPACVLWLFAWYDGWNNSFNKGYEQAPIGPLTGIAGIILFIAAMLYVPMAQARQAASGDWRSFYQFSLIWGMVRRHWVACLFLAALYSLASLPVQVFKIALGFAPVNNPEIARFTSAEALDYLNGYFFRAAFTVLPLFIFVRFVAARIYARAVLVGLQRGDLPLRHLSEHEQTVLQRLDLVQVNPPRSRHVLARVATKTGSWMALTAGLALTALVWFTFVAQIFISYFLAAQPVVGWLNQPLVQLPWFRYIPSHLQNPAMEIGATLLLLVPVPFLASLVAKFRRSTAAP